jgi:hypothetical protein
MPKMRSSRRENVRATRVVALATLALLSGWAPAHAAPMTPGCLPGPLPSPPASAAVLLDTATNFGERLHLQVWRQACQDGTGSAVLMHAAPTTAAPLFCAGDFTLLQGGLQHNAVLLATLGSPRFCADLTSPTTVILDAAAGPPIPFDREQPFTLSFAGWDNGAPELIQAAVPGSADIPVTVAAAVLPGSRSVQLGTTATAFATMIATGVLPAQNCTITPVTNVQADFAFWRTDPTTNQVIGGPNAAVTIPGGGRETFLLAFMPTGAFASTGVQINFDCDNSPSAPIFQGVNTLLLSAESSPVPDLVALVATAANDGIVNLPGEAGAGAFAVATVNVGTAGQITATADTGDAAVPVSINLCQTAPDTGQCISDIGPTVGVDIGHGETPTFAVFVTGHGTVPFDPGVNRVFVRFEDATGVIRGTTSVAVRTQ